MKTLLVKLTEAQANMLRYAAEYKLEQEGDGDGLSDERDRQTMIRAVNELRRLMGLGPSRHT